MDHAQMLLSKMLIGDRAERDATFSRVTGAGVTRDFFPDRETRAIFDTIEDYNARYGQAPTFDSVAHGHPNYEFIEVEEPVDELIDTLREYRAVAILESSLLAAVEQLPRGSVKVRIRNEITYSGDGLMA